MKVLAIDPGPKASGFVLYDGIRTLETGHIRNIDLLRRIRQRLFGGPEDFIVVLEQIEPMGMAVGPDETFRNQLRVSGLGLTEAQIVGIGLLVRERVEQYESRSVCDREARGGTEPVDGFAGKPADSHQIAARDSGKDLAEMQRHRDHWREYAYGNREKPQDFLDGNKVNRGPTRIEQLETEARDSGRLREYLRHKPGCVSGFPMMPGYEYACTCGLDALFATPGAASGEEK